MNKPIYLFVTPFFPSPESWRGAFCFDLAKALIRDGRYDVQVFVPGGGDDYQLNGVTVHRFPWKMLPSAVLPFLFRRRNERMFLSRVRDVGIDLRRVAVVHAHTAFFMPYALCVKRLNSSCKTLLHHWDPQSFGLNLGRLRHFWLHKFVLFLQLRSMHDQIDKHVYCSVRVGENFAAAPKCVERYYSEYRCQMRGLGWMRPVCIKSSLVLHNGVDPEIFHPEERRTRTDGFTIGCVANFADWKDQITLVKAAERVLRQEPKSGLLLRFIGSGPTLDGCRRYVDAHGLRENVCFETEVRHEQLPAFYHALDLFVLPSYFEGFGSVFTEAWASGVPFVTCQGQAMDDLLDEAGRQVWLFPPQDDLALAEKLLGFIRSGVPRQVLRKPVDFKSVLSQFFQELER